MALRTAQTPLVTETRFTSGHLRTAQAALVAETSTTTAGHLRTAQTALVTEVAPAISGGHLRSSQTALILEIAAKYLRAAQCSLVFEINAPGVPLVTVGGGNFQDALGKPVSYGYLRTTLIFNGGTGATTKIHLDQNGNVVSGTTIAPNDTGMIAGSYYQVNLHAADGTKAWSTPHTMTVPSFPQNQNLATLIMLSP